MLNTLKPHIIVDYDSTLANSQKAICDYYNSIYHLNPDFKPANWQEVTRWDMKDQCPLLYQEGRDILELFGQDEFFHLVEYFEGAKETMDVWHSRGYVTTVCTAGDVRNISKKVKVLERDFPHSNIVPVIMRESDGIGKSIVNMEGAIFIDDHLHNLLDSNAKYKILYCDEESNVSTEWNTISDCDTDNKILLARNWKEVRKIVHFIIESTTD